MGIPFSATFTCFFCGTGSNSFDFANRDYHSGELISTLARNHAGKEFVDWIIVDGPGSGNLQEREKWVKSGNYSTGRGVATGAGWEENVRHAVSVLKGLAENPGDPRLSPEAAAKLRLPYGLKPGEQGPLPQGPEARTIEEKGWFRTTKTATTAHGVTPQMLQQQKVKIFRKAAIDRVNIIGWSRGGVTCHMLANAIAQDEMLKTRVREVNIYANDPVPGTGNFQDHRTRIPAIVAEYVAIYARDERSGGFTPTLPSFESKRTKVHLLSMPGRHATIVGNAGNYEGGNGANVFFAPGLVNRHLAESVLARWGTPLSHRLNLTPFRLLQLYDDMMALVPGFLRLREKTYTWKQGDDRSVGVGQDWTGTSYASVDALKPDPVFVNRHHRWLFWSVFPRAYAYVFGTGGNRLSLELSKRILPRIVTVLLALKKP